MEYSDKAMLRGLQLIRDQANLMIARVQMRAEAEPAARRLKMEWAVLDQAQKGSPSLSKLAEAGWHRFRSGCGMDGLSVGAFRNYAAKAAKEGRLVLGPDRGGSPLPIEVMGLSMEGQARLSELQDQMGEWEEEGHG